MLKQLFIVAIHSKNNNTDKKVAQRVSNILNTMSHLSKAGPAWKEV
jgi:hypothetical protein